MLGRTQLQSVELPALSIHNPTIATLRSHVSMPDLALEEDATIAPLLRPMGMDDVTKLL